ncbi:hypothetical protein [Nitratireductor basaltis]|uniref:Uncharacterized protein n=1 Tax=Nitratireductor basaltis TaxID=472175 RepID=A0A084UET2_9HYPH|nr:hypothetical protein [Nitratireductor basaltis]KFB11468.1 hypothetical protein EL18_02516 [Nitratireductor basaltis]
MICDALWIERLMWGSDLSVMGYEPLNNLTAAFTLIDHGLSFSDHEESTLLAGTAVRVFF